MESTRTVYTLANQVEGLAHDLANTLYGSDLDQLYEDEVTLCIALADCFFGKYLMDFSSARLTLAHPLQGTEALLSKYIMDFPSLEFQSIRETLFKSCYNYCNDIKELKGIKDYTILPIAFSLISGDVVRATASTHDQHVSSSQNPNFVEPYVRRLEKLFVLLPEYRPIQLDSFDYESDTSPVRQQIPKKYTAAGSYNQNNSSTQPQKKNSVPGWLWILFILGKH